MIKFLLCTIFIIYVNGFSFNSLVRRENRLYMSDSSFTNSLTKNVKKVLATTLIASSTTFMTAPNNIVLADDIYKPSPWDSKLEYSIVKNGPPGDIAKTGENVAIRFKGTYNSIVFDDIFSSAEPYYYRAGVGGILKGMDDAVLHMKVGDRWKLKFSGDLSFEKMKPSSPGKPRIPAGAPVEYEVELVEIPGRMEDYIADYE